MAFDLIEVESPEGVRLLSDFRKSGFVMLVGTRFSPSRQPQLIVTESEAQTLGSQRSVIFKIHGCVEHDQHRDPAEPRTMIYTLGAEGELPTWKRRALYRLAAGRRLLVCGYSGRDFEICPELARLQAHIVWNTWDPNTKRENLTPNARRVLTAANGTALIGDMLMVLGKLRDGRTGNAIEAIHSSNPANLKERISHRLTDWELDLWRVRTLVGIGAASEGIQLAELMRTSAGSDPIRQFNALLNLGRSQFHAGRYRQAADTYREAAAIGEREMRPELVIEGKSDLVEALRCHGNWVKARKELSRIEATIRPDEDWLHAAMALRSVLLLRYYYELAKGVKIVPWMVRRLRQKCKDLLTIVVRHAKEDHWLELQQAELWADRLDIRFSELYDGPLNPLPSKDGYKQLGYLIAESMALRDDLQRKRGHTEDDVLTTMIEALIKAGALAELWKLVLVARRIKGSSFVKRTQREAFWAWWRCEYTPTMRLFVTLFH